MPRALVSTVVQGGVRVLKLPFTAVRWGASQVTGFISGVRGVTDVDHGDAAPSWWTRMAAKAVHGIPAVAGLSGDPSDQIYSAGFLGITSLLLSVLFPPLAVVAGLMVFPIAMGGVRLIPAVERGYSGARDRVTGSASDRIRRGR